MNKTWIIVIAIIAIAILGWYLSGKVGNDKEVTTSTEQTTTESSGGLSGLLDGILGFFGK